MIKTRIKRTPPSVSAVLPSTTLCIKRCHGLGNVVCLLPVLEKIHDNGTSVVIKTQKDWLSTFAALFPQFTWLADGPYDFVDLDASTEDSAPTEHRTDELARLLDIDSQLPAPKFAALPEWTQPFQYLSGSVVFAPEAGHRSRQWPTEKAAQLKQTLPHEKLVLIGTDGSETIPCDFDLREQLALQELIGLLAVADAVITMDSGVLHLAAALGRPTVAIFGGIDVRHRVAPSQNVVAIQSDLPCYPCNKNETCSDRFTCIKSPSPNDIRQALELARLAQGRIAYSVHTPQVNALHQIQAVTQQQTSMPAISIS